MSTRGPAGAGAAAGFSAVLSLAGVTDATAAARPRESSDDPQALAASMAAATIGAARRIPHYGTKREARICSRRLQLTFERRNRLRQHVAMRGGARLVQVGPP